MTHLFQSARDPFSSYSHFVGAGLSIVGLAVMAVHLWSTPNVTAVTVLSCVIFCLSLIALYSASGIYHFIRSSETVQRTLRKLDHAMIYVLIAGTYTPLLLALFPAPKGAIFTAVIWIIALSGIIMKLCWITAPRWLGASLYIVMGWAIVVDLPALGALPVAGIALLAGGGIAYTIGGIIYMIKHPNFTKGFGFHELFHLFVIAGSICHYLLVFWYII